MDSLYRAICSTNTAAVAVLGSFGHYAGTSGFFCMDDCQEVSALTSHLWKVYHGFAPQMRQSVVRPAHPVARWQTAGRWNVLPPLP